MTQAQTFSPVRHKPETLRLRSVIPTLTVNDIHRSLAWYRDVVGFVVAEEHRDGDNLGGAVIKAGTVRLLLVQDDFGKGRERTKGIGFRLYCETRQDVDRLARDIIERGGSLDHEPMDQPWGARDFSLSDPDGFKISISSAGQAD